MTISYYIKPFLTKSFFFFAVYEFHLKMCKFLFLASVEDTDKYSDIR